MNNGNVLLVTIVFGIFIFAFHIVPAAIHANSNLFAIENYLLEKREQEATVYTCASVTEPKGKCRSSVEFIGVAAAKVTDVIHQNHQEIELVIISVIEDS